MALLLLAAIFGVAWVIFLIVLFVILKMRGVPTRKAGVVSVAFCLGGTLGVAVVGAIGALLFGFEAKLPSSLQAVLYLASLTLGGTTGALLGARMVGMWPARRRE
jgi:hypothetical protein